MSHCCCSSPGTHGQEAPNGTGDRVGPELCPPCMRVKEKGSKTWEMPPEGGRKACEEREQSCDPRKKWKSGKKTAQGGRRRRGETPGAPQRFSGEQRAGLKPSGGTPTPPGSLCHTGCVLLPWCCDGEGSERARRGHGTGPTASRSPQGAGQGSAPRPRCSCELSPAAATSAPPAWLQGGSRSLSEVTGRVWGGDVIFPVQTPGCLYSLGTRMLHFPAL